MSQLNQTVTFLFEAYFNITFPSKSNFPPPRIHVYFYYDIQSNVCLHSSSFPFMLRVLPILFLIHPRFAHPNNIWWAVQIVEALHYAFLSSLRTFPLDPNFIHTELQQKLEFSVDSRTYRYLFSVSWHVTRQHAYITSFCDHCVQFVQTWRMNHFYYD
jgi:hypothetical protein